MSGFIGLCLKDGAFLAADSRRTDLDTNKPLDEVVTKIHKVNDNLMIATGGLGTYGHFARQTLESQIKGMPLSLDTIIDIAKNTFRNFYEQSLSDSNHNTPLYCILAGYDLVKKHGFIKIITSSDNFNSITSIESNGDPYFTGSNTPLVRAIASKNYFYLKEKEGYLKLDLWAYLSFIELAKQDNFIGFPIQLCLIRNSKFTEINNIPNSSYTHNKFFIYDFNS